MRFLFCWPAVLSVNRANAFYLRVFFLWEGTLSSSDGDTKHVNWLDDAVAVLPEFYERSWLVCQRSLSSLAPSLSSLQMENSFSLLACWKASLDTQAS